MWICHSYSKVSVEAATKARRALCSCWRTQKSTLSHQRTRGGDKIEGKVRAEGAQGCPEHKRMIEKEGAQNKYSSRGYVLAWPPAGEACVGRITTIHKRAEKEGKAWNRMLLGMDQQNRKWPLLPFEFFSLTPSCYSLCCLSPRLIASLLDISLSFDGFRPSVIWTPSLWQLERNIRLNSHHYDPRDIQCASAYARCHLQQ